MLKKIFLILFITITFLIAPDVDNDLADFVLKQKTFVCSEQSWTVDVKDIDMSTFDLPVKNPNGGDEVVLRSPQAILAEIATLDAQSADVLAAIRELL